MKSVDLFFYVCVPLTLIFAALFTINGHLESIAEALKALAK